MEMVLCDWTRMGHAYCFAGAVEMGAWMTVRPILHNRAAPVRNVGWSPFLFDGHCRWEVFELIGVHSPKHEPPHAEDVWIRELRPTGRMAAPAERRAILEAGLRPKDVPLFGHLFADSRGAAYLDAGKGDRSLVTLVVDRKSLTFSGALRQGRAGPDYRVVLDVPGLGPRSVAVVDHFLLQAAELAGESIDARMREIERLVGQMGERIAVRLGLTRPFAPADGDQPAARVCWLMADGFFSFDDPQP